MAKVYIDPGHGGADPGASGNGLIEKQWVLEVSLELAKILRRLGHIVKLTRSDDRFIGLSQRAVEANRWGADIFISIHFNAGGGFGWEDFIYNKTTQSATKSLQNNIHDAIKPILTKHGMKNRGKKSANFAVLRQTNMPAILVEGGFVDSSDHNILRKASYKEDVAAGIANGVQSYFGLRPVAQSEWVKNKTGWWYRNTDGTYPRNQWQRINNNWYRFNQRGYMQTGWQFINNKWYYMNVSGTMLTGWIKPNTSWYYLDSNGAMATGWKKTSDTWYYLNSSGRMQSGLIRVGGKDYYLQRNGALITDSIVKLEANKHGHLK